MIGRRVATVAEIEQPGDYCGPIKGYTGEKETKVRDEGREFKCRGDGSEDWHEASVCSYTVGAETTDIPLKPGYGRDFRVGQA